MEISKLSIKLEYVNYKGKLKTYNIVPNIIWFGKTEYHPEDQWLMSGYDIDDLKIKDFAMKDIQKWNPI